MSGQSIKLLGLLLALSLLGGCVRTPYRLILGITNSYRDGTQGANTYCTDGLEATLSLQDVKVESGLLAPNEGKSIDLIVPDGAGPGTLLVTEARCYRDAQEVGYVLVEKSYKAPRIPIVHVTPPPAEGVSEVTRCVEPIEARGIPICIYGDPYD